VRSTRDRIGLAQLDTTAGSARMLDTRERASLSRSPMLSARARIRPEAGVGCGPRNTHAAASMRALAVAPDASLAAGEAGARALVLPAAECSPKLDRLRSRGGSVVGALRCPSRLGRRSTSRRGRRAA